MVLESSTKGFIKKHSKHNHRRPIKISFEPLASADEAEKIRRLEAAFDVLFEEIFAQKDSKVDCRLPDNLIVAYGMEVVGNG